MSNFNWEINKQYSVGDIVCHNTFYFICMRNHLSLIPPGNDLLSSILNFEWLELEHSFINYIYPNKNLLFNPGSVKFRGLMLPGIYYNISDIVTQGGKLYICTKETVPIIETTLFNHPNFIEINREILDKIGGGTGNIDLSSQDSGGSSQDSGGSSQDSGGSSQDPGGSSGVFSKNDLFTLLNLPIGPISSDSKSDPGVSITDTQNSGTMTQSFTFEFFGLPGDKSSSKNTDTDKDNSLKRKLDEIEDSIIEYNKRKREDVTDIREKILLLNVDIPTKAFILKKYDDQISRAHSSDRSKGMQWLNTICDIPFGNYIPFPVRKTDSPKRLTNFFDKIQNTLDEAVYGQEEVKREIMEYVGKIISNRNGKGQVLALQGPPGVGKTKLIKSGLAKALGLPFAQINFGGMNDANILLGHDQTYVGSKPGKLVDILTRANCMNPIIYIDEIDKIAESKQKEIFGVLTHLLDPEQNHEFTDHYIGEVKLDLSKAFFIIAFNDIKHVDHIVSDRMKILHIKAPSLDEKIQICQNVILRELCKDAGVLYNSEEYRKKTLNIYFPDDVLEYIILYKTVKEEGVRKLRRNLESVINRINMDFLLRRGDFPYQNTYDGVSAPTFCTVTNDIVDSILTSTNDLSDYILNSMYI
jgi:DNA polymerase III delta prime subunit